MTDILPSALVLLACFYCAINLALALGIPRNPRRNGAYRPAVSVIVAARNEEKHIQGLVERLAQQTYADIEILIVNDRSTDKTGEILDTLKGRFPMLRILSITESSRDMPAKKHALETGIRASNGKILCFTDADCFPPATWVSSLVGSFDESTGLVAGYSPYQGSNHGRLNPVFLTFLQFEELRAAVWAAGSIHWNLGWLSTGRNLAYRRAVWDEVGGFEKIKHSISGDDDLFLQLVRRSTKWKIRYAAERDTHVATSPPSSLGEFLNQRTRHFSAGKFFTFSMKLFFAAYHGSNLLLYAALAAGIFFGPPLFFWAFIAKAASDILLISAAQRIDKKPSYIFASPFLEFLYLCYNLTAGVLGMTRTFRWKP